MLTTLPWEKAPRYSFWTVQSHDRGAWNSILRLTPGFLSGIARLEPHHVDLVFLFLHQSHIDLFTKLTPQVSPTQYAAPLPTGFSGIWIILLQHWQFASSYNFTLTGSS